MRRGTPAALHNGGAALSLFTAADLDDIHLATLETLERTGVWVESDEAIDIFADAGCRVDRDTRIVRIAPEYVTQALKTARSYFLLAGRDPRNDVMVQVGRVTVAPFAEGLMVNDLETGEYRRSILQDVADIAKVADACDELEINTCGVTARDRPEATAELHHLEAMLHNTTKPWMMSMTSTRNGQLGADMLAAVVGGRDKLRERPPLTYAFCPVGPNCLTAICTEVTITCARTGIPACCISMDMAGASSPVALAGTLVVQNCELLASLVLHQLISPGAPFYYGTSTCAFELRIGSAAVGTPETALFQAGTAAMATYYSIPSWTAGY